MYGFVEGGWNSVFADSEIDAYDKAVERWKDSENLTVEKDSFRLVEDNKDAYDNAMSMFW